MQRGHPQRVGSIAVGEVLAVRGRGEGKRVEKAIASYTPRTAGLGLLLTWTSLLEQMITPAGLEAL